MMEWMLMMVMGETVLYYNGRIGLTDSLIDVSNWKFAYI